MGFTLFNPILPVMYVVVCVDAELRGGGGTYQRGLSRSVSHPSYRALLTNSRDHKQRDNRYLARTVRLTIDYVFVCQSF